MDEVFVFSRLRRRERRKRVVMWCVTRWRQGLLLVWLAGFFAILPDAVDGLPIFLRGMRYAEYGADLDGLGLRGLLALITWAIAGAVLAAAVRWWPRRPETT